MAASIGSQALLSRVFTFHNVLLVRSRSRFQGQGSVTYCRRAYFSRYVRACAAIKTYNSVITVESKVDKSVVDDLLENSVEASGHVKYQNHEGSMRRPRTPQLPVRLLRSIKVLFEKYPVEALDSKTQQLVSYLQARRPPISKTDLAVKTQEVEGKLLTDSVKSQLESLEGDDLQKALEKHRKKVLAKLRSVVYHWQPMQYDAFTSYVYLIGRMPWDYAVILQCFTEISKRDKNFKPHSVYCYGSKVGSSIWAADTIWKKIQEHFCVDSSGFMNTIARLLLQDGNEQGESHSIKGVVFRQFQPSSKQNKFSLVVSPYMLMEQASAEERLQLVHDLWEMTESYLVLIENGTNAGFNLIDEAKEFLLTLSNGDSASSLLGHVFAPCPHNQICPKKSIKNQSCLTETSYMMVDLKDEKKRKKSTARYSYIIMKKGEKEQTETDWPRVLLNGKGSRHFHCHLCLPSGQLQHVVISKGKYEKHLYNCAKKVQLGDRLPVSLSSTPLDISSSVMATSHTDEEASTDPMETSSTGGDDPTSIQEKTDDTENDERINA